MNQSLGKFSAAKSIHFHKDHNVFGSWNPCGGKTETIFQIQWPKWTEKDTNDAMWLCRDFWHRRKGKVMTGHYIFKKLCRDLIRSCQLLCGRNPCCLDGVLFSCKIWFLLWSLWQTSCRREKALLTDHSDRTVCNYAAKLSGFSGESATVAACDDAAPNLLLSRLFFRESDSELIIYSAPSQRNKALLSNVLKAVWRIIANVSFLKEISITARLLERNIREVRRVRQNKNTTSLSKVVLPRDSFVWPVVVG